MKFLFLLILILYAIGGLVFFFETQPKKCREVNHFFNSLLLSSCEKLDDFYSALKQYQINRKQEEPVKKMMAEIFPMSEVMVGKPFNKRLKKHPYGVTVPWPEPMEPNGQIGFGWDIKPNKFWSGGTITVNNGKVQSVVYTKDWFFDMFVYINDKYDEDDVANAAKTAKGNWKDVKQTAQLLLEQLKQLLGSDFERKIVGRNQEAVYVWRREKDVVAFTYRPLDRWEEEGYFYQMYILPSKEAVKEQFPAARDCRPEDAKLWLDAME